MNPTWVCDEFNFIYFLTRLLEMKLLCGLVNKTGTLTHLDL